MISGRVEDKRTIAATHKQDFIQRVIACRHRKGQPTRSWTDCELKVQNAQ